MGIQKEQEEFLEIDLPILFSKMSKDFNKDYVDFLKPYGLGKLHAFYLICLYKCPNGIKLKDLNELIGCDKSNTSRALADLQDKGIVCKDTDSDIEKKYMVMLTDDGREIAKAFANLVKKNVNVILSRLTQNEVETLFNIVKKLIIE